MDSFTLYPSPHYKTGTGKFFPTVNSLSAYRNQDLSYALCSMKHSLVMEGTVYYKQGNKINLIWGPSSSRSSTSPCIDLGEVSVIEKVVEGVKVGFSIKAEDGIVIAVTDHSMTIVALRDVTLSLNSCLYVNLYKPVFLQNKDWQIIEKTNLGAVSYPISSLSRVESLQQAHYSLYGEIYRVQDIIWINRYIQKIAGVIMLNRLSFLDQLYMYDLCLRYGKSLWQKRGDQIVKVSAVDNRYYFPDVTELDREEVMSNHQHISTIKVLYMIGTIVTGYHIEHVRISDKASFLLRKLVTKLFGDAIVTYPCDKENSTFPNTLFIAGSLYDLWIRLHL